MSAFTHWLLPHESNNQRAKLLHPSSLALIIAFFAIFQIALGQVSRQYPQILGYASQIAPAEIIRLTNLEREKQGLSDVNLDPELSAAAAQKAADMFARDYWAHVSPIGTQPWFFITAAGYNYRYAGENLARDFSDPNSVVTAWMNSPSHRENLLSAKYHDIGVAVVDGKLGGQETTLVVQMFGTKLAYAPQVAKSALDISVKAAEEPVPTSVPPVPQITPTPAMVQVSGSVVKASPFGVTKTLSLLVLVVIIGVLVIDVILVARRKIVRWTSRSLAHLVFMLFLLISAIIIYRGQII